MVAFPVHDCWKRHKRKIAVRNFQWTRRQPKFSRGAGNRFQAGTIGRCVTELSNPCQTYLATKMSADHSETGGTAIHLIDLHDMVDLSETFSALAEQTSFISKWIFLPFGLLRRLLPVELHFVVYLCCGRE